MKKIVFSTMSAVMVMSIFSYSAMSQDERPEYQKEYEAYMRDLEVIAQTGKAPENPGLDADLAKMDSEDKIRLTAPKTDFEHLEKVSAVYVNRIVSAQIQDTSKAQIVNSVEIIRVPEEFRQQYIEAYGEDNQTISAQDLGLAQASLQRKIVVDESTAKIASHINPFRFLTEVPLSLQAGEYGTRELPLNPMVDAYFNQFGRPYVAGSPQAPVAKAPVAEEKKENKSLLNSLSLKNSMFVN